MVVIGGASLLGLISLGMAMFVPVGGLLLGTLLLVPLRLPQAVQVSGRQLDLAGWIVWLLFTATFLAISAAMWRLQPPVATEYGSYGGGFIAVGSMLALTLGFMAALSGVRVLARRWCSVPAQHDRGARCDSWQDG